MGDENTGGGLMNLDLNLGPGSSSPETDPRPDTLTNNNNNNNESSSNNNNSSSVNLEDWIEGQEEDRLPTTNLVRESSNTSRSTSSRIRRWRSFWGGGGGPTTPVPPFEARSIASEFILNTSASSNLNGAFLQTGEGSMVRNNNNNNNSDLAAAAKDCFINHFIDNDRNKLLGGEDNKLIENEGSFFECNICLDVSSDPVLTCCGHLFCWPCLYQWLNVHSDSRECPVCKGEVTVKNLTPIYGRGGSSGTNEQKPSLKIPDRPQAKRVESWRQTIQRNAFAFPMDEMIRRLGNGSDFSRDFIENHHPLSVENLNESHERNSSLLNRILTSRGMRQEQTVIPPQEEDADDVVDFTNTRSHTYRSSHTMYRAVPNGEIVNIARRLMEYTSGEEQALLPVFDDSDSVSSIAAVIHSESQTVDTAVEIDSTVSLSTSSSRRRVDPSRVSDVDSGDSRVPRRRRLN